MPLLQLAVSYTAFMGGDLLGSKNFSIRKGNKICICKTRQIVLTRLPFSRKINSLCLLSPALPLAIVKVCDKHKQTYTQLQRKECRKFKIASPEAPGKSQ